MRGRLRALSRCKTMTGAFVLALFEVRREAVLRAARRNLAAFRKSRPLGAALERKEVLQMKICVVGAGAIGGLLAAKLARAARRSSVVARGAHLAAIRADGLTLIEAGADVRRKSRRRAHRRSRPAGSRHPRHQGASGRGRRPPSSRRLWAEKTMVLTAQNGIPWWYFFKHGGPHEGGGSRASIPAGSSPRICRSTAFIASVVYPAAEIAAPGVIRHIEGNRFSLAEIDGTKSERVERVSPRPLRARASRRRSSRDVRAEIWTKLWGNLSFNPISALTHATLEDICRFAPTRALAAEMMREAQAVGEALGVRFRISIDKRIAGAEAVGAHKTSMLQDVEAGRAIEADALLGSVIELGALAGVATPHLDAVYALVKLLAQTLAARERQARDHARVSRRSRESREEVMTATPHPAKSLGRRRPTKPSRSPRPARRRSPSGSCARSTKETIATLNGFGIGRGDRVAIVLPNGPEMAAAFIAIASRRDRGAAQSGLQRRRVRILHGATSRPRRWSSKPAATSPAIEVARRSSASLVLTLTPARRQGAGDFALVGRRAAQAAQPGDRRARRHRADPAHVGHDLAAEDRAAVAAQCRDLGRQHRAHARSFARPIAASTSCRCSTSTG